MKPRFALSLLTAAALSVSACGIKRVSRVDPNSVTDLSGRWNDTDSRLVANELIAHNSAVEAEGPDWWKRLSPNGGADPKKAGKKGKKAKD